LSPFNWFSSYIQLNKAFRNTIRVFFVVGRERGIKKSIKTAMADITNVGEAEFIVIF
jgi:hypothetical protein